MFSWLQNTCFNFFGLIFFKVRSGLFPFLILVAILGIYHVVLTYTRLAWLEGKTDKGKII